MNGTINDIVEINTNFTFNIYVGFWKKKATHCLNGEEKTYILGLIWNTWHYRR